LSRLYSAQLGELESGRRFAVEFAASGSRECRAAGFKSMVAAYFKEGRVMIGGGHVDANYRDCPAFRPLPGVRHAA